jgi:hypothetical protein
MRRAYRLAVYCIGLGLALFILEKLIGLKEVLAVSNRVGLFEAMGWTDGPLLTSERLQLLRTGMALVATPLLFVGLVLLT